MEVLGSRRLCDPPLMMFLRFTYDLSKATYYFERDSEYIYSSNFFSKKSITMFNFKSNFFLTTIYYLIII